MDEEALQKAKFLRELGANVERLIYQKFKTKGAFLAKTGIFKATLHDITTGKADPQILTLWKIAKELNISVKELLPSG
jgi:transcriptional regulator with XRE-family HTH domain